MNQNAHLPLILAVDDEASNLQLLRQILQDQYRLLFAKDGARALELARQEHPDLILLDVMMPGMTGHEACRMLKADPATAGIPVIFVTALTDADERCAASMPAAWTTLRNRSARRWCGRACARTCRWCVWTS